eukprot:7331882-Prymnesium_polylepis.1
MLSHLGCGGARRGERRATGRDALKTDVAYSLGALDTEFKASRHNCRVGPPCRDRGRPERAGRSAGTRGGGATPPVH